MLELLCAVVFTVVALAAVRVVNTWAGDWHDEILVECGVGRVEASPGLATWTDADSSVVEHYLGERQPVAELAKVGAAA